MQLEDIHRQPEEGTRGTALWIALVTAGSVLGSLAFACAAPLAAMATIAGVKMRKWDGAALVGAAWLANQLVGYLVLDYPRTWDSFGWGAAIGVASVAGYAAARLAASWRTSPPLLALAAFAAAFIGYEGVLYAATAVLPATDAAFSAETVLRILQVNALALAVLLAAHRAALTLQLVKPVPAGAPTAA